MKMRVQDDPSLRPRFIRMEDLEAEIARAGGHREGRPDDRMPVHFEHNESLALICTVHRDGGIDMVRWGEIPWDADEYEDLLTRAFNRFTATLSGIEPERIASASGLTYRVTLRDPHDSLLLLVGTTWRRWTVECRGELLAAVPAHDVLLIADAGVPGAREELAMLSAEYFRTSAHPLSERTMFRNQHHFGESGRR
ncbi:hypothetical protein ACQ86G_13375 [Roseateles chitinivorans]|uniref:hypothetical protein n=1 Tax=Roseateles chitinivorans TaxID=2917965 RepID=UPI003D67D25C